MTLLLARHGESTWNAEGRYQGRCDAPLSERGILQATALAEYLSRNGSARPNAIVSSPLSRARDTADIVAHALGLPVETDERLIEISHGAWEGLLKSEIAARWPDMLAQWRSSSPDAVRFPGGESLDDVRVRWQSFLLTAPERPSPLFIVTHDVIVRISVLDARGRPLAGFNEITSENAALTELDFLTGNPKVIRFNERGYLGDLRADPAAQAL